MNDGIDDENDLWAAETLAATVRRWEERPLL